MGFELLDYEFAALCATPLLQLISVLFIIYLSFGDITEFPQNSGTFRPLKMIFKEIL